MNIKENVNFLKEDVFNLRNSRASAKECDLEIHGHANTRRIVQKQQSMSIMKFSSLIFSVAKVNRENQFENHRKYWKGEHSEDFILR